MRPAGGRPAAVPLVLSAPLLLLLGVPTVLAAVRTSPEALAEELAKPETRSAVAVSLATSVAALAVSVVLGTPLAYWLARSRSRFAVVAETLVDLPTVLPPAVAGVALLLTLGRNGPVGSWLEWAGMSVAFTPAAVVIAQVFVASPYYVRAARAGFAAVGPELREAATIDGATGWGLFRRVVGPLAGRSLGAGAAMCWSRALGEFGATILFAGNLPGRTQTMPLAIYVGFEGSLERALALSTVLIAIAVLVLCGVRLLAGRAAGA